MKKPIIIAALIFTISCSLLAGTLASYTITLDKVASGSVVGKEFIFTADGTDIFQQNVKIAPKDLVVWQFSVRNYDDLLITETDLYYNLAFEVTASTDKQAIEPLIITIKDANGKKIDSVTGTGLINVYNSFLLSPTGQKNDYTVEIYWPSNDEIDINYAGNNFSTAINVSATASQVPFDINNGDDNEDEPRQTDTSVLYEAGAPWIDDENGINKHQFRITITNTSDTTIHNWNISMIYPGQVYQHWQSVLVSSDLNTGSYTFRHPDNYNQSIAPGESITFGGLAVGKGEDPITSVMINGFETTVRYQYGISFN